MVKVEIDIDIPDGWEFVGYRNAVRGESFLRTDLRTIVTLNCLDVSNSQVFVIRKQWVWPEWLAAPWIAMDESGIWWIYQHEPFAGQMSWRASECFQSLLSWNFNFTPPPCDDWTKSKRRNPNLKGE